VDVSTGEFLTTEIPAERLHSELARFRPAECITPNPIPWEGTRMQILEGPAFRPEVPRLPGEPLRLRLGQRFRLETKPLSQRACGAILSYLHSTHFDALGHLNDIRLYSGSEYMVLDEVTLRNLEILRNIRDRSRRGTLLEFLSQTRTAMGART